MSIQTESASAGLTAEQLAGYQRDGYLVVENLITAEELDALHRRLREYTHGGREPKGLAIQIEPRIQRGELKVDHPGDGIRKIDGLVENDDLFRGLGAHPNIIAVLEKLIGPDIKLFRNTMLLKPPRVGSAKGMHQDSPYWPIEPMALCSCWFPLDEATPENGCMGVIPGGHKRGPLPHHHITDDFVIDEESYNPKDVVLCPMQAGSGLFFHSLVPHATSPNQSDKWRRAIALSYMSSKSRYTGEGESPEYLTIQGKSFPGCVR